MSRVLKHIKKKVEYNFKYLVYLFAEAISLKIIGRTIKKLNSKLIEKHYLKFTKELWVIISDQLPRQTLVNKVKSKKKDISLFFGNPYVFSINTSNSFRKFICY